MAEERTRVMVDVLLDCGCWVEYGLASTHGIDNIERTLQLTKDMMPHHFDRLALAHKCELVSDDNPNGSTKGH